MNLRVKILWNIGPIEEEKITLCLLEENEEVMSEEGRVEVSDRKLPEGIDFSRTNLTRDQNTKLKNY